jgi:hypothetical protein
MEAKRSNVTGLWQRNGSNGTFYTGNFKKSELLKLLEGHSEDITFVVNQIEVKTSDKSPDIRISINDNTYKAK